jgi:hypothetical protein
MDEESTDGDADVGVWVSLRCLLLDAGAGGPGVYTLLFRGAQDGMHRGGMCQNTILRIQSAMMVAVERMVWDTGAS